MAKAKAEKVERPLVGWDNRPIHTPDSVPLPKAPAVIQGLLGPKDDEPGRKPSQVNLAYFVKLQGTGEVVCYSHLARGEDLDDSPSLVDLQVLRLCRKARIGRVVVYHDRALHFAPVPEEGAGVAGCRFVAYRGRSWWAIPWVRWEVFTDVDADHAVPGTMEYGVVFSSPDGVGLNLPGLARMARYSLEDAGWK